MVHSDGLSGGPHYGCAHADLAEVGPPLMDGKRINSNPIKSVHNESNDRVHSVGCQTID